MNKGLLKRLILLITYAVVLVAAIVKIDTVIVWVKQVVSAFSPLLIGFVIAFVLNRPCNFFNRLYGKGLKDKWARASRPLAVATAYVIFLAALAVVGSLVIPELVDSISTFIGNLSTYGANLQALYDWLVQTFELELLAGVDLSSLVNNALGKLLSGVLDTITNTLPTLISSISTVVSGVITTVLAMVFSVYMLAGAPKLVAQCRRLTVNYLPKKLVPATLSVARLTADTFTRYVSGQLIEAFILGVLCFVGMIIFGFDYAPLISVIIAVCALVPIAGAYIGAIASAVLLVMIEPMQAVWFLVFLIILQQLEGNLIYPRVVGSSIGLPGIWVLAAVTVGSSLLGFAGLVAGVPITAVVYTLLRSDLRRRETKGKKPEDNGGEM